MKAKVSKEIIGLVVLLTVFVVAGIVVSNPSENSLRTVGQELVADPSIYNNRSSGSRSLYLWTKRLGYHPRVELADWSHLPPTSKLLISVAPESVQGFSILGPATGDTDDGKLSVDDAKGVETWLKGGRTLLLLTSRLPVNQLFLGTGDGGDDDDQGTEPTFGDIVGVSVDTTQEGKQRDFVPMQPSTLVSGVDSIRLDSGSSRIARKRRDGEVLFATVTPQHGGISLVAPSVMIFAVGRGRMIVVSDDYFVSNRNLAEADNAAFVANVITTSTPPGSDILFDEYHHGAVTGAPDLWSAMGRPLQAATWQLILVCFLIVAMVAPRFGAIKALNRGTARASGEYLSSLAGLYQRADATVPALEVIYGHFLRELCSRLALPPDVPLEKLAEAAARSSNIKPDAVKRLIIACESALDRKQLTAGDLIILTKRMEELKRQLN